MNELTTYDISEFYSMSLNTIKAMSCEGLPFIKLNDRLFKYEYESVEDSIARVDVK